MDRLERRMIQKGEIGPEGFLPMPGGEPSLKKTEGLRSTDETPPKSPEEMMAYIKSEQLRIKQEEAAERAMLAKRKAEAAAADNTEYAKTLEDIKKSTIH